MTNSIMEEGKSMAIRHQYDDDQTSDLIINLVPELRRRIKIAAARSGLSVKEYVEAILEQTVPPETQPNRRQRKSLNRAAVDELLRFRGELKRAHPGEVFEDSVETLRQLREERTRELEQSGTFE